MQLQNSITHWKRGVAVTLVGLLVMLMISQTPVSAIDPPPSDLNVGPYVDKLVYKVIENEDQRILALQAGEIEVDTEMFPPEYLPTLFEDSDIDIYSALRNGYGAITINCERYPLNISGLRRAFAFAFDKTAVTANIMDGFSQEHDSLVPYANGWCVEDEFEWNYYTDQSDIGNQILDDLGFEINETSGFRLAPNGERFEIEIKYSESSPEIAGGTAQIGVDALLRLHIDARSIGVMFNEYIGGPEGQENWDMVFGAENFYSNDIDWLGYDYWSEYASTPYQNPSNFANATYDSYRNDLLYGTTYEEVHEAAAEMQKILHYNVPKLVVYMNTYMQGYRNDQFTGHVQDLDRYISGPWTMRKIHKLDGSFGGTVPISCAYGMSTFNFFVIQSSFSSAAHTLIFDNLYSSLFKRGPDLNPWPDLAESMLTETHADNPAVPDGHTRFTIDIIQNATWSDGEPLTADDVAFSYTYAFESAHYGNPAGTDFGDLVAAYTPNPYRVVLEYSTESYWHFSNFAYDYIIPEHIFNGDPGIDFDEWNTWNPILNPAHPHVTCGPYVVSDYENEEFCELSSNPLFHYQPRYEPNGPSIGAVSDISYDVGSVGNHIVWEIYEVAQPTYSIYMDGELRESGLQTENEIVHNIDGLQIGTYTFTLNVTDILDRSASRTVHVSVVESVGNIPIGTLVLSLSISSVSVVVILIAIISIYRKRKFH